MYQPFASAPNGFTAHVKLAAIAFNSVAQRAWLTWPNMTEDQGGLAEITKTSPNAVRAKITRPEDFNGFLELNPNERGFGPEIFVIMDRNGNILLDNRDYDPLRALHQHIDAAFGAIYDLTNSPAHDILGLDSIHAKLKEIKETLP